jgi:hypothetical protein
MVRRVPQTTAQDPIPEYSLAACRTDLLRMNPSLLAFEHHLELRTIMTQSVKSGPRSGRTKDITSFG